MGTEPEVLQGRRPSGRAYRPGFHFTIEHQIRAELAEALKGTTRKVWRTPMFSLRRVEGWYKYGDAFLIRPAPGNAPRPEVEYAQHPWILEFSFVESSDFRFATCGRSAAPMNWR